MLVRYGQATLERRRESRSSFLGVSFDCLDQSSVVSLLQKRRPSDPFCYVVTPNSDHIARIAAQPSLQEMYQKAWLCLCDSRPVQLLSKTVRRPLTHVTGSDLTGAIFERVLVSGDTVNLIVAREEIADKLMRLFPQIAFQFHVPPFGLIDKPDALLAAALFIIEHPARFTFVAIGSPQSELIVSRAKEDQSASGTALCVGASLEFITGDRPRAPAWMNKSGLEWMHRIATDPRRLWKRYAFSVLPLLQLYWQELSGRVPR